MRDLRKAKEEYKRISQHKKGAVYKSDFDQIFEMCKGDVYRMTMTALEIGIAIGYRLAKRERG